LRRATEAGHTIGNVAQLADEQLESLIDEQSSGIPQPPKNIDYLERAVTAIKNLDAPGIQEVLDRGAVHFGQHGLLLKVVGPLAQTVGDLWETGEITAAHEHLATSVIRTFLTNAVTQFAHDEHAPGLVVATLAGQLHELGAVIVAAAASNAGWRVTYLGPSLPAAEIAGAAIQSQSRAVALSLVFPEGNPDIARQLAELRRLLGPQIKLIVGGRAALSYKSAMERADAVHVPELSSLLPVLRSIQRGD
jgi:methanogenic corrinoid protein MtbC1